MSWSILNIDTAQKAPAEPAKKIVLKLGHWENVRQYDVLHNFSIKTRNATEQGSLQYNVALASLAINEDGLKFIELTKYGSLLDGAPPEAMEEQLVAAMQSALYPYVIATSPKGNRMLAIRNFDHISTQWRKRASEINNQQKNAHIKNFIAKMGAPLASKEFFFETIRKDFFLQALFFPVYGKEFVTGQHLLFSDTVTHDLMGTQELSGTVLATGTGKDIYRLQIDVEKTVALPQDLETINKEMAKHYDTALLQPYTTTMKLQVEQMVNGTNGKLQNCRILLELTAGSYYHQADEIFIDLIGEVPPQLVIEGKMYKTAFVKEEIEISI